MRISSFNREAGNLSTQQNVNNMVQEYELWAGTTASLPQCLLLSIVLGTNEVLNKCLLNRVVDISTNSLSRRTHFLL